MMIDRIDVKPVQEAINPELLFELILVIQRKFEIPFLFSGSVLSDENKKITNIIDFTHDPNLVFELSARNVRYDRQEKLAIKIIAPLNHKVVDYLDTRRTKNPKGDVVLNLEITVRTLTSKVNLSGMIVPEEVTLPFQLPDSLKGARLVFYQYPPQDVLQKKVDQWILSGDSSPDFLEIRNYEFKKQVIIKSSDWIHDYCPVYQLGKFTVFEYPIPNFVSGSGSLEERLNESTNAIRRMEENLIKGEWNQVIEDSRAIMELLRKRGEIKDLLKADGYTEPAIEELVDKCLQSLFDFSSKFHHKVDRDNKKIMAEIKASKEDAYLIYSMSIGIVNLISKKMQRLGT